jgi:hypothetical protein
MQIYIYVQFNLLAGLLFPCAEGHWIDHSGVRTYFIVNALLLIIIIFSWDELIS